ncbi:MAG TPA: RNB domain-containing ribonuclease [Roseiflexaceae bacterium]|nr:RNB domain-containing ribonuclease [Roseiflexaceae bacterium]
MTANSSVRDLRAIARQAMLEAGFAPDLPPDATAAVGALKQGQIMADAPQLRDLRGLLWSSIDNADSRDLDQVEFAEQLAGGDIRVLVGIADVDAFVPAGSAIDRHAAANATSVYTGVITFPMLPERLSTDLTSLREGADRAALVVEFVIGGPAAGTTQASQPRAGQIYRALVHNHARLDYATVGPWLEGSAPAPPELAAVPGLEAQLPLQDRATEWLRELRHRNGALDLETIEASVVAADGVVLDLMLQHKNRARYLIESLMIAANSVMAGLLEQRGSPAIERVVRTPARWPRIVELAATLGEALPPEPDSRALADFMERRKQADPAHFPDLSLAVVKLLGAGEYTLVLPGLDNASHFGLAAQDYTHATAPNRRYADLVTQRLVKASLAGAPIPYTNAELEAIAEHCNERDRAAKKVERRMRKTAAVALMDGRIGETFDAIVTGAAAKGTFVRLLAPPVEGRVVRGERGLDVGDQTRVRLVATDYEKGFIDFERA